MIFISIILSICLSAWICLHFVLTLEEMNKYQIVYKFWYGVKDASAFCTILLAALWLFVLFFSIFRAIVDSFEERKSSNTIAYNGFYDRDDFQDDDPDDWDFEDDDTDDWETILNS